MKTDLSIEARNKRAVGYLIKKDRERIKKKVDWLEVFMELGIPVALAILIAVLWFLRGGVR